MDQIFKKRPHTMTNTGLQTRSLSKHLTSYDLLKTFAVIIMVIDHMGAYFFPDDLWWRSIGRIGFPIWFFLVGYARGRDIPHKLVYCILILTFANFVVGKEIFPLNALVTIALIRVLIDPVMNFSLVNNKNLILMSVLLFVTVIPTYFLCEYGTLGLLTAMFGYMVRNKDKINNDPLIVNFMIFALCVFIGYQALFFQFTLFQFVIMAIGTTMVRLVLYYFKSDEYPQLTEKTTGPAVWFTQFCGRRTLEIYVVHLVIFKLIALYMGFEGYSAFELQWFNE